MPNLEQIYELSPIIIFVGGLNFLIWVIKVSFPSFPKNRIPILCIILGATIFPFIANPSKVPYTMRSPLVSEILMGILMGGCSVGLHQVFLKQLKDRFGIQLPGETEIYIKTSEDKPPVVEIKSIPTEEKK